MTKVENNGVGFHLLLTIEKPSQQLIREMLDVPVPRHINLRRMSVDFVDNGKNIEVCNYSNTKDKFSKIRDEIWPKLIGENYKVKRFNLDISEHRETKITMDDNALELFINNSDKSLNEDARAVLRYWFENLREFKTSGKTEPLYYYTVRIPRQKSK
ncbi:MAG: hypothetical protein PHO75_00135 [Candidatus Shapirobacteria bacterium]|jgi:hypothetical protein|nr:hypothetical protein [Candidatus Shapirobacteria bacterium]